MSPEESAAALAAPPAPAPPPREELLTGWGRTSATRAAVLRPGGLDDAEAVMREGLLRRGGVIPRGSGLSYGDAAQNGGGAVLDATALRGRIDVDADRGLVRSGAGRTFAELLRQLVPRGLTLPVAPGTARLTVGGAIAADVHGKNHVRDGSLAAHVSSFTLATPARGLLEVSATEEPELFAATFGGMGLTGLIVEATLRTAPLRSTSVQADFDAVGDVEQALALMSTDSSHCYSIAWLDLLASGPRFGRAIVTRSLGFDDDVRHTRRSVDSWHAPPPSLRPRLSVPERFPAGLLRPSTVAAFNACYWQANSRRGHGRSLGMRANLFPLDTLGAWNRLYGAPGLVQYQFAVPVGGEDALLSVLDALRRKHAPMYLAVLKRFGRPSGGPLSFPLEGWTVAIDIPAGAPGLRSILDEQDECIADAGGRIYLAKDSGTRRETLHRMYPQMQSFLEIRAEIDPDGALGSDLSRRLGL
jgi:decaprenylphospho-beta-D-ribofuranose 2-oxidase